jgi:hypothetical protein
MTAVNFSKAAGTSAGKLTIVSIAVVLERLFGARCGIPLGNHFWRNDRAWGKRRGVLPQGRHCAHDELRL